MRAATVDRARPVLAASSDRVLAWPSRSNWKISPARAKFPAPAGAGVPAYEAMTMH